MRHRSLAPLRSILSFLCVLNLYGQSQIQIDSLKIENFTRSLNEFYQTPESFYNDVPIYYTKLKDLVSQNPQNTFLKKQLSQIADYQGYFLRKKLKNDSAFIVLKKNILLKQKLGDSITLSRTYRFIGDVYLDQNLLKESEQNFLKAVNIANANGSLYEKVFSAMRLASLEKAKENYEKALNQLNSALKLAIKNNFILGIAEANFQISSIHRINKDFLKAEESLQNAMTHFQMVNDSVGLEKINVGLARHYRKTNQLQKALIHYNKSIEIVTKLGDSLKLMNRYLGLSNTYEQLGDYENAYKFYLKYKTQRNAITDAENIKKMADLEAKFKYDKQRQLDSITQIKENELLVEKVNHSAEKKIWLVAVAALIVLLILIVFYNLKKQKQLKIEKAITEEKLEKLELQEKLNAQNKRVEELHKESIKNLKIKEHLIQDLNKVAKSDESVNLKSILTDLKSESVENKKLLLLKEQIDFDNIEFNENLKKRFPKLSPTDLEVITLIKVGLKRKEIASLRKVSLETVKSSRFRIKKKLELDKNESLDEFIKRL